MSLCPIHSWIVGIGTPASACHVQKVARNLCSQNFSGSRPARLAILLHACSILLFGFPDRVGKTSPLRFKAFWRACSLVASPSSSGIVRSSQLFGRNLNSGLAFTRNVLSLRSKSAYVQYIASCILAPDFNRNSNSKRCLPLQAAKNAATSSFSRSEEHTSELQSLR